jgi:hypothetical protein
MHRFLAATLLAALGTACAFAQEKVESKDDPKSDNKEKILGKWRITEVAGKKPDADRFPLYTYFEFKQNGQFVIGFGAKDAEGEQLLKTGNIPNHVAKYKLLAGEGVEVYDVPKSVTLPAKAKGTIQMNVKLDGDAMTITEDSKTTKLVRLKEKKDPPEKK